MLTPEYLKDLPTNLVQVFEKLEEQIIEDIARRIKEDMELSETADYQIDMLNKMGYSLDEIEKMISKATKIGEKEIEEMLKDSSYLSYENDKELYKKGGKKLPDMTPMMDSFIKATIKQTKGELRNLTNTMGFIDNGKLKLIDTFYKDTLDYAVFQLSSGAFDYNTVLRQAVKRLGDSGVRTIDYKSGRSYHIESAVRMNVMTGMSQITGYMSLANADMMGQDLMEITAHSGARPDHQTWQGQIVSREGRRGYLSLNDIGYDTVAGFKGANCRHDWFPFFEGISEPAYTKEDLNNIDPPDFEYDGRSYTAYEASQKQRQIERSMRQTKRQLIAYNGAGLKEDFTAASIKLRRQRQLYEDFSKIAGLRAKHERSHTYNYDRSMSMKSVWARR